MNQLSGVAELLSPSANALDQKYVGQLVKTFRGHFDESLPPTIWHYTTLEKFKQIIASNQIWFTHVSSLNDMSEVEYAANISRELLDKFTASSELTLREKRLLQRARSGLLEKNNDSSWFISSFTEENDDLNQWNAYGDHGNGVAIGFGTLELIRFFSNSPNDRPMICQVCYDIDKLQAFGNKLVELTLENFRNDFSGIVDDTIASEKFIEYWGKHVDVFSVVPKHHKFASEKEWRFASQVRSVIDHVKLHTQNGRQHMRMGRGGQSDSQFATLPIAHVMMGPTTDHAMQEMTRSSLVQSRYINVTISRSEIPLRKI